MYENCCPSILNILRWQQQLTVWICVLNLCFESGNDLSVHVVDFQVYISFCEMSLQIYCHFLFIGLFLFSLLNFKSSLCVWVTCFIRYDFYKYLLLVWSLLVILMQWVLLILRNYYYYYYVNVCIYMMCGRKYACHSDCEFQRTTLWGHFQGSHSGYRVYIVCLEDFSFNEVWLSRIFLLPLLSWLYHTRPSSLCPESLRSSPWSPCPQLVVFSFTFRSVTHFVLFCKKYQICVYIPS